MSKKNLLATALVRLQFVGPLRKFQRAGLVILAYHRIRPEQKGPEGEFDEGVLGPTQEIFDAQVKWLKQNFDLLGEDEILALVRERRPYRSHFAAITFDDGYRDNYTLALPVLTRHSAPAIFFICPGLIDSGRLGWWDLIAYLVKKSTRETGSFDGQRMPLGPQAMGTIEMLQNMMKTRPNDGDGRLVEELSAECGVPLPDVNLQVSQLMSWEQIQEAHRRGIAIGSHTQTHPVLATVDEAAQHWEMRESKAALERRLGSRIRSIAYPVGRYGMFTAATMRIAEECGYEAGFSFRTGYNFQANASPFNIRRFAPTDSLDPNLICSATLPSLFLTPAPATAGTRGSHDRPRGA